MVVSDPDQNTRPKLLWLAFSIFSEDGADSCLRPPKVGIPDIRQRDVGVLLDRIEALKAELETERGDPAYQKKLDAGRKRRANEQVVYAADFETSVREFLNFDVRYNDLESQMARQIADHATPVGSGTVARTKRIPIERRAEAATIAWMRHQTTAYDDMTIQRVKGKRREVRQMLAKRSKLLLNEYRNGSARSENCPLEKALK